MVILMAIGASLGLVAGAIFLFDKLDRRVRFPEEVTHGLRLPVLAAIPRLKNGNGNDQEQMSQVIEAFRGLRLRLMHASNGDGSLVTAITSPGSGDGKSFVAVNLALAFADQGFRTLLIDGDVRRGGLHRFLGVNRQPGLTNLLAGSATIEEVIQRTNYRQLDLIGCGTRLQIGPELLGSPVLTRSINELRSQYAVILVDTPPLGAGVDPFVLGTATGNLLVVLRTGYTDREFAEAKLGVLDHLPVRILGGVLNGVPAGTGAYRYYSYISGYEASDEQNALESGGRVPVTTE
jgi:tyrosine-protein kinase Etk/Wzc